MDCRKQIAQKIITDVDNSTLIAQWKKQSLKIVFSNGCFDILHRGHVDYLSKAATFGDKLIVGLNTDASVRRLKGSSRPIVDQDSRAFLLAALCFVDAVCFFDADTPYELIKTLQPDVLVKGADYRPEDIVGYDVVMAKGGTVKTIDLVPNCSTSLIVEKIKKGSF